MDDRTATCIRLDGLRLDVRRCVSVRERSTAGGVAYYLSLLEDEIEERVEQYWARACSAVHALPTFRDAPELELTDALVAHFMDGRTVVLRGASCTVPLFWCRSAGGVHVSTHLPLSEAVFSRAGCAASMAAVCLTGSYEPNAVAETPLHGWRRLRRGIATTLERGGRLSEEALVEDGRAADDLANEEAIAEHLRAAFGDYGRSQRAVTSSVLELSGGYDSTLAGAAARAPRHAMRGISVEFPYYEFRFEAAVQASVGAALGIPRTTIDGTSLFPYAPWVHPPRFDEPAVFVTGIRHAELVAAFAASHGATRIYVGHGGDQLFSTDLTAAEPVSAPPARAPFSRRAWKTIRDAHARIGEPFWRRRSSGCFVYDARQDVWIRETFGATIRTPFSNLALLKAARLWSARGASQRVRPDKTILAKALAHLLPDAVVERKGKVAYDGVWMRAYATHAEHIARTFERASALLEHVGVSPAWLLRRTRQLADWQPVSDREVLAAYALAAWFLCWDVQRVSDVAWS